MKRIGKYLLLFVITSATKQATMMAQNLVPNPSFEIHDTCPDYLSEIERALGWKQLNASPDYFHKCATYSLVSIPDNVGGYQQTQNINDSAYAGLTTYMTVNNAHEIMGINLSDTLIVGRKYYVSFLISAGRKDSSTYHFTCFSDRMGAKFVTHPIPSSGFNPSLIDNVAQVYSNSIISDTINWVLVKGSFVADSAYTFVMIGNFFTTPNLNYTCLDSSSNKTYSYIDNVCVSTDSSTCFSTGEGIIDYNNFHSLFIYPNPASNELTIKETGNFFKNEEIQILNSTGQLILKKIMDSFELKINCSTWPKGLYLIKFSNYSYKIIII